MYQSEMLHKYQQNITFNVINTQIHTKKIHAETRGGLFFHRGGKCSIIEF